MTNWVFIRGLGRQKTHWKGFPEKLQARLGGDIHCLDLPGVGEKSPLKSPLRISEYSENLHQELSSLKSKADPQTPWALVAVSLGGMVGLDWVSRFPSDFQTLVTINTSSKDLSPLFHRLQPRALKTVLRLFWSNDIRAREKAILELTTNLVTIDEELLDLWVSFDRQYPLTRPIFLRQLLAATGFRLPPSLPTRTLVLASEQDHLAHPQCSRALARHFQTELAVHPTAGHDLVLDAPEWAIDQLEKFMMSKK